MPYGDRRGPDGFGPMTGRGMGYCAGYDRPGYANQDYGRGYGRGFGRGYGRGMGYGHAYPAYYPANVSNVSEKTVLENDIKILKEQLSSMEDRLSEINKEG